MQYLEQFEPDKFYHIFNHAVGFEDLYKNDENKRYFLQRYADYMEPVCSTFAYCLMNNHFHFMVQIRSEAELLAFFAKYKQREEVPTFHKIVMQQFSNFCNAYAKAFNKEQNRTGALFIDYVKRTELETRAYQKEVIRYIHYNPVKHGFTDRVQDWQFSSFHSLISEQPTKLARATVLEYFGGKEAFLELHKFNDRDWTDCDPEWEFGMY